MTTASVKASADARGLADDPRLVLGWQAVPEPHTEVVEKLGNVHSPILAKVLSGFIGKRTLMPRSVRRPAPVRRRADVSLRSSRSHRMGCSVAWFGEQVAKLANGGVSG